MSLTIEESTTERISPQLCRILTKILAQGSSSHNMQKDIMFSVIIVLMGENKFLLANNHLGNPIPVESIDMTEISKWKLQSGLFEASFILSGFKNIVVKLIMSPLGAMILVNVVIKDLDNVAYTVCMPISRYVVSPQATSLPMIFRDLKNFATIFKNNIISPVKSKILSHFGYASASLVGLPEEIILKIMLFLPITAVINISKTCTRLRDVLESDDLWHVMCKRDFIKIPENYEKDWKTIYKELYISIKEIKPLRTSGMMHDYMDYSDYVSYIDNPMWDVLI